VKTRFVLVGSIVIAVLIVDSSLGKVYNLVNGLKSSDTAIIIFIAILSSYSIGLVLLLQLIKYPSGSARSKTTSFLYLNIIQKIVSLTQYFLIGLLAVILLQIFVISEYSGIILMLSTTISYALSISITTFLSAKFFSWFLRNRNFVTLCYGIFSGILAIKGLITLIFVGSILTNYTAVIASNTALNSSSPVVDPFNLFIKNVYFWSSIFSFVLIWISTAIIMRHYSNRIGKYKYWILFSVPLLYFLTQFISPFLGLLTPFLSADPVFFGIFFSLLFSLSRLAGGILFGISFWTVGKSLPKGNIVRDYMAISTFGLILFFVSDQNTIVSAGAQYPPFGVTTVSFLGFASYMMMIGLYSAIISLSEDTQLRRVIRKLTLNEVQLLDNIVTAEKQRELEKRILKLTREQEETLTDQTGIIPSISGEDAKQYLDEVMAEVKKDRPQ
jgi:hypothetical protein